MRKIAKEKSRTCARGRVDGWVRRKPMRPAVIAAIVGRGRISMRRPLARLFILILSEVTIVIVR